MNQAVYSPPGPDDWAQERGKKWAEHLQAMESMLAPVDQPLVEALNLASVQSVADIGCGGGVTTRSIAQHLPDDARVHGYDISPELTSLAEETHRDSRLGFFCADAQSAVAQAPAYDRLSSRFGVMFFAEPTRAFKNLHSWLHPRGRFAFAVWGPPAENPWMMVIRRAVAELVDLPSPEPDAPGPFRYENGAEFSKLLLSCGFENLAVDRWQGDLPMGGGLSADAAARFALSAFGVGDYLSKDADLTERARQNLVAELRAHEVSGRVMMQGTVNIVTGEQGASPSPR